MRTFKSAAAAILPAILLFFGICPGVLAVAVTDATISLSNLTISADSGTVSISDLGTCASVTGVFNSKGQTAANSNPAGGCGAFFNMATTDVSTSAAVTYANGSATAHVSPAAGVSASSAVNIPTGTVQAGVTLDGSLADLVGSFQLSSTAPLVNVTFSMLVTGLLHGFSNNSGYLQTDDVTGSLSVFVDGGVPLLFDFISLPSLASIPGINKYPVTTLPISETLTSTLALDPTQGPFFFDLEAQAESQAFNIPEPGSEVLLLTGLIALARCRIGRRRISAQKQI